MNRDSVFLTTAIDYTNAPPHLGHAYEKILADCIARHYRQRGKGVFFLTGVDQHGQKVQQAAARAGISPAQYAKEVTSRFLELWQKLAISYDGWAETTHPKHKHVVQNILQQMHNQGELYKAEHRGFYSVRQEQFLTDKERNENGEFGQEWGEVIELVEENWYFRLSSYREWLAGFLERNPELVFPAFRSTELRNAVSKTSGDLCISRPKSRLSWGIEFPFDDQFVTYVWFDALINYISFAGFRSEDSAEAEQFWTRWPALHIIGKDILVPAHGIYWLTMLKAIGFRDEQMPSFLVHGYVNIGGEKMSKTLGNVVDPFELVEKFGAGAMRYYLMAECVCGQDMDFSTERLILRYNTELANGLGNLLNRTANMARRYRNGQLKRPACPTASANALLAQAEGTWAKVAEAMDGFKPQEAIAQVFALVDAANKFAEAESPWKLAKDPTQAERLDSALWAMAVASLHAASLLAPFLPTETEKAAAQFQTQLLDYSNYSTKLSNELNFNEPHPVFPRLETEGNR